MDLKDAERICAASQLGACAEVIRARGRFEMEQSHFVQAQGYYERSLVAARERNDLFLEAIALLNLSWCLEEQSRLDDAVDRAAEAYRLSTAQGFADIVQNALGNEGWAYYKLGDAERGRQLTIEARDEASKLLDRDDEVKWLTNAGLIDMDAGRLGDAQGAFQEALGLARTISSREDIINAEIVLAFLSEQTGKLDDAKRYADEALTMAQKDKNGRDQVYPLLVQGRLAARAHDTATAENTFREVAQSPDCPVFLKWEAERSLARLYEDENHFESAESEYRTALTTFETARSELKHEDTRLPFLSNASHIYDDYIHFLVAQGKTAEALQVADFSRGRTLAEGLGLLQKGTSFNPERMDAREVAREGQSDASFLLAGREAILFVGNYCEKDQFVPASNRYGD